MLFTLDVYNDDEIPEYIYRINLIRVNKVEI